MLFLSLRYGADLDRSVFLFLRMWFLPPMSCLRSLVQHHVFLPVKQMIFVAWFRLLPGVSIFIWGFLVILRIPEVFSRRFMKWNATIIVAFRFFFQSTRTDQNSSTKVLQNIIAANCTIWSSELNQKGVSCFPRNIPYPARPKGPPFHFFSALRDFFSGKFFSSKGPPFNFFAVLPQNGCWKIPKGPPFQFFSAL